jgi:hypothetical protein
VGLPNVGKSTLFKILTSKEVHIANYPFATIDPNIGVVPVPDERLQALTKLSSSKKTVPAIVEFYDIAGLVKGAYKGEGLGNQFLAHIREVNAIVQIVRCFKHDDIVHVEGGIDPVRDLDIISTELVLKDLDTVTNRLDKAEGDARSGKKEFTQFRDNLKVIKKKLNDGTFLSSDPKFIHDHAATIKELNLLTSKAQLFLLNGESGDASDELKIKIKELNAEYLVVNLAEAEKIPELVEKAYTILNFVSFLTTGEDETRAWTIERGFKAPQAAGVIHTDFESKFIRAEVINWQKLIEAGGWVQAKQKGWLRLEGKEYIVNDGDVMVIRHG